MVIVGQHPAGPSVSLRILQNHQPREETLECPTISNSPRSNEASCTVASTTPRGALCPSRADRSRARGRRVSNAAAGKHHSRDNPFTPLARPLPTYRRRPVEGFAHCIAGRSLYRVVTAYPGPLPRQAPSQPYPLCLPSDRSRISRIKCALARCSLGTLCTRTPVAYGLMEDDPRFLDRHEEDHGQRNPRLELYVQPESDLSPTLAYLTRLA